MGKAQEALMSATATLEAADKMRIEAEQVELVAEIAWQKACRADEAEEQSEERAEAAAFRKAESALKVITDLWLEAQNAVDAARPAAELEAVAEAREQIKRMPEGKAKAELTEAMDGLEAAWAAESAAEAAVAIASAQNDKAKKVAQDLMRDFKMEVNELDDYYFSIKVVEHLEEIQRMLPDVKAAVMKADAADSESLRTCRELIAASEMRIKAAKRANEATNSANQMMKVAKAAPNALPAAVSHRL